jgi:hypothetical protein
MAKLLLNQPANVAQPRAYWYAVSLVVLVAGVGLAIWQVKRSATQEGAGPKPVRGAGLVQFDQAGSYSLYVTRGASRRMDAAANAAWERAKTATVNLREERAGSQPDIRRRYETIDLQNTLIARLVEFEISSPGTFRVEITPPLDEIKPFIRAGTSVDDIGSEVMGPVVGVISGLGIGLLAVILAGTMFFIVWRRRKNFRESTQRVDPS